MKQVSLLIFMICSQILNTPWGITDLIFIDIKNNNNKSKINDDDDS